MNPLIASMVGPRGAKQFARTTDRSLGDLDAAKRLLGGRRWSELPREDKLEIKRNTGWQLGPGGDWLYETGADPVFTPAFNERFSPWLAADKGFSAALKTLYDTVGYLKAEESAIANSWNERHPRNLYSSFLPHVYNPSYAPRGFAAELALSDYDSAVKFAARLREDGLVDTRDREMYRSAKRFLDRPELSKAIAELSNAMKRAKETEFKPFVGRLSDMVDLSADPEFAIAYPDFKDIDVAIVDAKDPELMGSFSAKDNKLTITKRNLQKHGLSGALHTALHELAHARQFKEGAAPGGDEMTYIIDSPPGRDILGAYRERLTRMEDTLANGSWLSKQLLGGPETLRNRIDVYRRTLAFLDQERSRFDQIAARADQADDKRSRKYYLYRRLAGEVDARNAETRQGLDREARSSTLLEDTEDIPRSDQIDARFGVVPGWTVSKAATVLEEHPYILQQAAQGGEAPDLTGMSNFLATDKVPDTIFGIPVVSRREDYTEADIAFFKDHPEAGGYYDMGEGTPEDGSDEGAPVQNDVPKGQLPSATFITGGRDEFDTVEMVQQALKNNYSAEQFLRMYYGDATDRIVGRAKELRGMPAQDMSHLFDLRDYQAVDRGSADPEARSLPRYASGGPRGVIVFPDLPIIAVGPGAVQTNEITKEVMTNIERAAHTELPPLATYENVFGQNMAAVRKHSRDNVVLATQKQLYRDMEKWLKEEGKRGFEDGRYVYLGSKEDGPHEVSHLLNPNEDLRYAVQYGPTYYLQNDAELAAAISAARREIFKRSGGKIDIADPRHMRAVLNEVKPGATDEETKAKRAPYEGRWLSTEARKFLYNYWTFKGSSRAADVNRKVVDPEFTGKLASAKRPRKDRV